MLPILLQVDHLTLTTSRGRITTNVSFQIHRGEIVALTGKSGIGKSSIAHAIMGLLPSDIEATGRISYFKKEGERITYPADSHVWSNLPGREIGFMQQDMYGAFDPVMRMGKQMMMILQERALNEVMNVESTLQGRLTELGLVDTQRIWRSFPHQLSGGQLQRCQLALVSCLQPALLIADEPTSAIDKITQVEILDLLRYIRDTYGISILCITHDETVVKYLCDREISLSGNEPHELGKFIPQVLEPAGLATVLKVESLGFKHRFGGIIERSGAEIHGLSFILRAGSCTGIIGESGSGKSTLANMLVGLLIPSEGSVFLDNEKIDFRLPSDIRKLREKVQLVMQDGRGSLHPGLTIRKQLEEVTTNQNRLGNATMQYIEARLIEVGLSAEILDRLSSTLSGGECLRVNIARALMVNPSVLICDESTSALDRPTRNGIINLLRKLMNERDLAIILISHDPDVITSLAQQLLVFEEGSIIESGPVDVLSANAEHATTKRIFASRATILKKSGL